MIICPMFSWVFRGFIIIRQKTNMTNMPNFAEVSIEMAIVIAEHIQIKRRILNEEPVQK